MRIAGNISETEKSLTSVRDIFSIRHMSKYDTTAVNQWVEMFKALANHNRLSIFLRLVSCCPVGTRYRADDQARQYVGELARELNIAPSTVSHHRKELRRAGLIKVEQRGKQRECWVDGETVKSLADVLTGWVSEPLSDDQRARLSPSAGSGPGSDGP